MVKGKKSRAGAAREEGRQVLPWLKTALAVAILLSAVPRSLLAVSYESPVFIDEEQDLYELFENGELSEESLDTLLELYRNPLDLNVASREELYVLPDLDYEQIDAILAYRQLAGRVHDPADLVAAGVLSQSALEQIAPFLLVGARTFAPIPEKGKKLGRIPRVSGSARLAGAYVAGDTLVPPMFLQSRLRVGSNIRAGGAMVLSRRRLGEVAYDPSYGVLSADRPSESVQVPKFFAQWDSPKVSVIAGTFRLGFGQRLTLDNSGRYTPDGFYPDDVVAYSSGLQEMCRESKDDFGELCGGGLGSTFTTSDFRWSNGFRGAALTLKNLDAGILRFKTTAFASYQSHSIHQYRIYDSEECEDPRLDDKRCKAPPIHVRLPGGELGPKFKQMTLPNVYDELAGGANLSMQIGRRAKVGLTGYYATTFWQVEGMKLDFQDWHSTPFGGPYGAFGADAAWGTGPVDLFVEVARSLDSTPGGGGGYGVLQRSVLSMNRQELELSLRYYDRNFANPYARSISSPSQLEGLRTRNELGARLRYQGRIPGLFRLRGMLDFYGPPEDSKAKGTGGMMNLDTAVRADYVGLKWMQPSLWGEYRNKDLAKGGREQCFQQTQDVDEFGVQLPCSGELYRGVARMALMPVKWLTTALQYQHTILDDKKYNENFRHDSALWFDLMLRPLDSLRIRTRARWLYQDVSNNEYLEQSLWAYADATWLAHRTFQLRGRYDLYMYLDERGSTLTRIPNPEHRFRLELETRF